MRDEPRTLVLPHEQHAGEGQRRARHEVVGGYHETTNGWQGRVSHFPDLLLRLPARLSSDFWPDFWRDFQDDFRRTALPALFSRKSAKTWTADGPVRTGPRPGKENCDCFRTRDGSIKKRVKRETIQRVATPTGILVGLSDELAAVCTEALGDGGLRVLRAGHVAAASERIPVVMPQLVIVSSTLRQEELDILNDRCVAVGAEVMRVAPDTDRAALVTMLRSAANAALIKALRSG